MRYEIVYLPDGTGVVVDKCKSFKITPDEWYVNAYRDNILKAKASGFGDWDIVIATLIHRKPDIPYIDVPFGEDEVIQAATDAGYGGSIKTGLGSYWIEGYKVAQAKGRYSEKQMKLMWDTAHRVAYTAWVGHSNKADDIDISFQDLLASLNPRPIAVELEMEEDMFPTGKYMEGDELEHKWQSRPVIHISQPPTITKAKWIYE